jgi:metal-sulfur cluster biosynthetic enzyme
MDITINNTNPQIYIEDVKDVLKSIFDPEIDFSIYDIGLIYEIHIDLNTMKIIMTLTSVNCPEAQYIPDKVKEDLEAKFPNLSVEVEITFEPAWTVDNMSDEVKLRLGLL